MLNTVLADALRGTVEDYFVRLNTSGGIYSRQLRFTILEQTANNSADVPGDVFMVLDLRMNPGAGEISTPPSEGTNADQRSEPPTVRLFAGEQSQAAFALYPHPRNYNNFKEIVVRQQGWQVHWLDETNCSDILTRFEALSRSSQSRQVLIPRSRQLSLTGLFSKLTTRQLQAIVLTDSVSASSKFSPWLSKNRIPNATRPFYLSGYGPWPPCDCWRRCYNKMVMTLFNGNSFKVCRNKLI